MIISEQQRAIDGKMTLDQSQSAPKTEITAAEKAAVSCSAAAAAAWNGAVRPVSSSPDEEGGELLLVNNAADNSLSAIATQSVDTNSNNDIHETDERKEKAAANNNHNDAQPMNAKVDATLHTNKGSNILGGANGVDTSSLQLLGGNKKRKRKNANKSQHKKKNTILSSFQEEDDEGDDVTNKRMMDDFLQGSNDTGVENNVQNKEEGKKLAKAESKIENIINNNNEDDGSNENSSSISPYMLHSGAVIPPIRVMSPMPQNERENVPLCHSPNVPDVDTTATVSGLNSNAVTTIGGGAATSTDNNSIQTIVEHTKTVNNLTGSASGGGGRLNNTIRTQQANNVGQMRLLQQQQHQASQQLTQRFTTSANNSGGSEGATKVASAATSQQQQQHSQPPGWRVKLYRLNMDGTWDDCGTGRIQFYYARGVGGEGECPTNSSQPHGTKSMNSGGEGKKPSSSKNLFWELGEPMLCMRAEVSQKQQQSSRQQQQQQAITNISNTENKSAINNNFKEGGPSSSSGEKVLLRTRVLLQETYQCQGGNIITWCEPFHAHGKQKEKGDGSSSSASGGGGSNKSSPRPQQGGDPTSTSPAGVDLALSFQDNAGCKDIWQHILNVQSCAREMSTHSSTSSHTTTSSSSSIHTPLSPIKATSTSTHAHPLHNSPNSPDHDFVEDKLIAGGGGSTPLGGISSRPSIWTKDANIGNASSSNNVENRLHSHNHAPPSNNRSSASSSSDDDEEEEQFHEAVDHMTAVSMAAAAAAASYNSPRDGNNTRGGSEGNNNVSSPLPVGNGGGGVGVLHGFHGNNNQPPTLNTPGELNLPESPTWDDLQNIGDVIADVPIPQRDEFLMFLVKDDCAYIKLLLDLLPPAEESREDLTDLAVIIKMILLMNDPEIIEYVTMDAPTFESVCAVLEYDPELLGKANHREFIRNCAKFRTVVRIEEEDLVDQIHHLFRVTYLRDNVLRPTMDEGSLSTLVSLAQFTQTDIIKGVITAPKAEVAAGGKGVPGMSYFTKVIRLLSKEIDAIRSAISDGEGNRAFENEDGMKRGVEDSSENKMWQQHLAPQDSSLSSRLIRRKGALMFLKELFCKARTSLQEPEKNEFIDITVTCSTLLNILGGILSDPNVDIDEQGAALEIISVVAMHNPCVIRRHCLQGTESAAHGSINGMFSCLRPDPNNHREVIFICPPDDLLLSVLFVMSTSKDAGILLQTSEIIRIILDTDIVGDESTLLNGSFMNEENDINAMNSQNVKHDAASEEQNSFLALFYDRYIQWLVIPFQYKMFISKSILPLLSESNRDESFSAINQMRQQFKHCSASGETSLMSDGDCSLRAAFTLEILSFCVRAHVYRMKFFILRTRLLGTILKVLCQKIPQPHQVASGDNCLKLASLKFLRSVLSVKDEFYHRHIVQYNLFAPVFEAFRIIPVGSNLISSAILEMCDFIRAENIKSLLDYIVTKHLKKSTNPEEKSLEDIANPYVATFTQLRRTHEENIGVHLVPSVNGPLGATFNGRPHSVINKKALEDQRKYREAESEDSYFNDDDDDDEVVEPLRNDQNAPPPMTDTASLLADVSSLE